MTIPDHIIVRIYFKTPLTPYRKFYWFEMKGDDLYWGPSKKSRIATNVASSNKEREITITVPDNFRDLPKLSSKHSYHHSGQSHYKIMLPDGGGVCDSPNFWKLKNEINEPHLFFTTITPILSTIDSFVENPKINERKNEYAVIITMDDQLLDERLYIEFYLSPEGTYPFPQPLFGQGVLPFTFTHSLSQKLILVGKFVHTTILSDWQPDIEINFKSDKI